MDPINTMAQVLSVVVHSEKNETNFKASLQKNPKTK